MTRIEWGTFVSIICSDAPGCLNCPLDKYGQEECIDEIYDKCSPVQLIHMLEDCYLSVSKLTRRRLLDAGIGKYVNAGMEVV